MTVHIVVVGDSDIYDDLYTLWESDFESKSREVRAPEHVPYLERAEARIRENKGDFIVVIVNQRARLNKSEIGEPDLATVTERLGDLQGRYPRSRIVLCLQEEQLRIEQMVALQEAGLAIVMLKDARMIRRALQQHVQDAVSASVKAVEDVAKDREPELEAIAEFRFHVPDPALRLHIFYNGYPFPPSNIPIRGDNLLMQRFLESSREVDKLAMEIQTDVTRGQLLDAMITLDKIGSEIMEHGDLIREYGKLADKHLNKLVRFRITTSAERYPCLFEALRIGTRPRPLVLEHPTCRSVDFGQEPRLRLDWSRGNPLNILVVVANVPSRPLTVVSEIDSISVKFRPLPFAESEAEFFENLKEAYVNGKNFRASRGDPDQPVQLAIGRLQILRDEAGKEPLVSRLQEELEGSQYDILHFIGHAYAHPLANGKFDTRLVLPTGDPQAAKALTLVQLAGWLDQTKIQFVYLSCCSGMPTEGGVGVTWTSAGFPQLFQSIPITLGFRWDVVDKRAFEFAEDFYTELFVHGCDFDEAMRKARLNLFDPLAGTEPMWASPVLLAQGHGNDGVNFHG